MKMAEAAVPAPVVKRLVVGLEPQAAFRLFTEELTRWWPLATYSCAGDDAVRVAIEPCVGGGVVEHARDGSTAPWGNVLAWEPPHRFAMSWHPQSDPAQATRVEVAFTAEGADACRIELVHSGWEARGSEAQFWRDRYDGGWVVVLKRYADAARTN
jgi:uncharacterized protein YndB with AHSA1/START domain